MTYESKGWLPITTFNYLFQSEQRQQELSVKPYALSYKSMCGCMMYV